MKKTMIMTICTLVAGAGLASADTLSVLGTPDITPLEGNYSMVVSHDNSTAAYVRDDTPDGETIYRYEFLFDPNGISPETGNWRQGIFSANGQNPRPNNPNNPCPMSSTVKVPLMRVFLVMKGGLGQNYFIMGLLMGNQCGYRQISPWFPIDDSGPVKICAELVVGLPGSGAIAVVGPTEECPSAAGMSQRDVNNNETAVGQARLGAIGTNGYGQGENGDLYFDSFASFRTLAP